ncbi:OmpA/MotB family protein [Aestuariispira ectoiniformans]|uniref:OmpA/MotB family protein n=1 Tax=Aestuariispira ectoiniformans TaxID=2775080 RepID=UPI00223B8E23|nr:flagellar motor protein MotB [Aestuariispira ectoiniformans]
MYEDDEHEEDDVEKAPPWLISFGDVTALMLTFFVMLFAMSQVNSEKWDAVISVISTRTKIDTNLKPNPNAEKNISSVEMLPALPPEYLSGILKEKLADDPVLSKAKVSLMDERVIISLPSRTLFLPESSLMTQSAERSLFRLAGVLNKFGNQIVIEGHTDPSPVKTGAFSSNWELSLARALAVSQYLKQAGYPYDLTAMGEGSGKYRFLNSALSEERRYELARRVDIVIYADAGGQ